MSIYFITDTHLGVSGASHTTPASRARLRENVYVKAAECLHLAGNNPVIHLGDLFDKTSNDEGVIVQGLRLVERLHTVLAGNHDLPSRDGKTSSLDVMQEAIPAKVVMADIGESGFAIKDFPEATLYLIPHVSSQELFSASLDSAMQDALERVDDSLILCLHCNYDSPFAEGDATLNLGRGVAETLLDTFDYIVIGHEHQHRMDFDGRLIVLGNTHPTSFSDVSEKLMWRFDGEKFIGEVVWNDGLGYVSLHWTELLDNPDFDFLGVQFIQVGGIAPAAKLPEIAAAVADLWSRAPDALMIRNAVEAQEEKSAETLVRRALSLPDRVSEALKGTELEPIWSEYKERVLA